MKHDMKELLDGYQAISIPKELEARVKTSIAQAKVDTAQANTLQSPSAKSSIKRPGIRRYLLSGISTAAAAVLVIAILANSNAAIAQAMEQIPILGAIAQVVTFRKYQSQENNMQADLKIPEVQVKDNDGKVLEGATDGLNNAIQQYTDEIIAAYEADVKASGGEGIQDVTLDYKVVTDNDTLFSLSFQQSITMAGAYQSQKIYHMDKGTGNMITLQDLFQEGARYQTVISENIKEQMKQQMEEDENKYYYLDSGTEEWDFDEISSDVNFYVNESGKLVIVFDEYQVAPGYMGIVTFEIPTEILSDIVKDGYLN